MAVQLKEYLQLLRPKQWMKNVFIFAGLIFSKNFFDPESVETGIYAFIVFSLLSSSGYIFNDILDYREDAAHPLKAKRPIAAGRIRGRSAAAVALLLAVLSFVAAWTLNHNFFFVCLTYSALMVLYSAAVKRVVILDVFAVAFGYVLRAIAGAVVIGVDISSWLLLCTLLIALFLVVSKRRTEMVLLGDDAAKHRKILAKYSLPLLNQMISIVTASCIVAYCLYTLAPETVAKFGTKNLIYTVPFVIYGLFRYLYVTYQKVQTDMPERVLFNDRPLQVCLVAWIVSCVMILAFA
ncbi:MAG: decaprenyl-phosphate phosphoribosyltransferase [candidate division WOR-3 bacterium]|nr:MAG: decaprenyl-phosphate phosphoribosyltransferase [candidate division WOR-3 bacterium]